MEDNKLNLQEQFILIHQLFHRCSVQDFHARGPVASPYRGQGRILRLLQLRPEISQKDLTYLLDMRPQSLGELLSKLERSEFITRTPSESDKRVMNICLTEKGIEAANQVEQPGSDNAFFKCLSDEEQSTLSEYLERIIADIETLCNDKVGEFDCQLHEKHGCGSGKHHHGHGGNPYHHRL